MVNTMDIVNEKCVVKKKIVDLLIYSVPETPMQGYIKRF